MYKELIDYWGLSTSINVSTEIAMEEALARYEKVGYMLNTELIEFMKLVVDRELQYAIGDEVYIIDFRFRKILKDYPKWLTNGIESKYSLTSIVPLAEIHHGYMLVFIDSKGWIYGVLDTLLVLFGKNLVEGILNICKNKELVRLSE